MSSTKTTGWKWTARALWALAALLALRLASNWWWTRETPGAGPAGAASPGPEPFRWPAIPAAVWSVFRSGEPPPPAATPGSLASRYRLAGVFLILSDPDGSGSGDRCAILDDLRTQQQILAAEGEWLDQIRVAGVFSDHVVLADGEREERIELAAGTLPGPDRPGAAPAPPAAAAPKILESNRFGNRIGETRWDIDRQAVMGYYREMMDNPERLAALFLAMEPDRDPEGKVAGYRLNTDVGEKEFYTQVGLRHGDVIRRVNSMRMTSQRRAEHFIGEFVQNRLGAVVIDIERDGAAQKLVYLVK